MQKICDIFSISIEINKGEKNYRQDINQCFSFKGYYSCFEKNQAVCIVLWENKAV